MNAYIIHNVPCKDPQGTPIENVQAVMWVLENYGEQDHSIREPESDMSRPDQKLQKGMPMLLEVE